MPPAEAIKKQTSHTLRLDGQEIECRVINAKTAKKIRIKVKPAGVELVMPENRNLQEGFDFVAQNQFWVLEQLERARQLYAIKRPDKKTSGLNKRKSHKPPNIFHRLFIIYRDLTDTVQ